MRCHIIFLCIALLVLSLVGCASRTNENPPASAEPSALETSSETPSESSASAESQPSRERFIESPPAELKIPGEITVYKIYWDSKIYEPYKIPVDKDEVTLFDIVTAVEKQLEVKIPVKSITQQKGMVIIDIGSSFIGSYGKAEMYQILTTLAATLQQNHIGFEWIQYQLDGEVGIFGELWEIPPLKLIEGSPEEFAAIRAKIPYEGLQDTFWIEKPIIDTDDTGWQLTHFLAMLRLLDKDISSPAELDNKKALETAIYATKFYTSDPNYSDNYAPELKPLEAPASEAVGFFEDWFWLKEHIEQSARLLYGDDFVIKHEDCAKYRYLETIGVYTPPHMGGGYNVIPVIFNYEDLGDRYKIELAYITASEGGYLDPDVNWEVREPIAEKDLKQYLETKSKRREVILKKVGDGRFTLVSHKYL